MRRFRNFIFVLVLTIVSLNGVYCSKGAKIVSLAVTPFTGTMVNGGTSMANNTTRQIEAIATFSDGSTYNFTSVVEWSSSDETVATVDNAVSKGTVSAVTVTPDLITTITAIDAVNHKSASIVVTVTTPLSITITPANPHMQYGAIHQFLAMANFTDTTTQDVTSFSTWTVQPIGPANVTNITTPGLIGGGIVSIGTVTDTSASIEATFDFASLPTGSTPLTVTSVPISSITVTPTTPIISAGTTTQQFNAIGTYVITGVTSTVDFTTSVTWGSSNTAVATIDSSGLVTRVSDTITGTITIYATDPITNLYGFTTLTVE